MAKKVSGAHIVSKEWAKHLRKKLKRSFWKAERKASKNVNKFY